MFRFKTYLSEYLTPKQHKEYSRYKMSDKARSDTDHHFGPNNDIIHGTISGSTHHDKSEIHKAVEHHINRELSHEEYKAGLTKDKYNRDVKLGKTIKDDKLRNDFASDKTREGIKMGSKFATSTVRGAEAAGQSNPESNKEHPSGHSWHDQSCKNITDGIYKDYLKSEVRHGTVLHRVHDHDGKEIYRAGLQPHHDAHGHVAYDVNSEYGVKHPAFTKSAHETATKLSIGPKDTPYKIHDKVYNDHKNIYTPHPDASSEDLDTLQTHHNSDVRRSVLTHRNAKEHHIDTSLNDNDVDVKLAALTHPNAREDHLDKGLKDPSSIVRSRVFLHKKVTDKHIDQGLNDKSEYVRAAAANSPNAKEHHIDKGLKDTNDDVRKEAARNINSTPKHIEQLLKDPVAFNRHVAEKLKIQRNL